MVGRKHCKQARSAIAPSASPQRSGWKLTGATVWVVGPEAALKTGWAICVDISGTSGQGLDACPECYDAHHVQHIPGRYSSVNDATFTFRGDAALKNEFTMTAKARDRTGALLLRDFMRDVVSQRQDAAEYDAWSRRQVQIGQDSANAGNLMSATEVDATFAAKRKATRRRFEASK